MSKTVTYELLEQKLGQELAAYVTGRRDDGDSWAVIARSLYDATQMAITPETLRNWFADLSVQPKQAAS